MVKLHSKHSIRLVYLCAFSSVSMLCALIILFLKIESSVYCKFLCAPKMGLPCFLCFLNNCMDSQPRDHICGDELYCLDFVFIPLLCDSILYFL